MNWDQIQGQWKQLTGTLRERWGKLTDGDLAQIQGKREQLEGKLQERYGISKEEAGRQLDEFMAQQKLNETEGKARRSGGF